MSYAPPTPPRPDLTGPHDLLPPFQTWRFASRLARLGGFVVDGYVFAPLFGILWFAFGRGPMESMIRTVQNTPRGTPVDPSVFFHFYSWFIWIWLFGWVGVGAYDVILTKRRGQTLGKMAASAVVVRKSDGQLPSWGQAIIRFAIKQFLGWISAIFILWDKERQALHDKAANTVVIHKGD